MVEVKVNLIPFGIRGFERNLDTFLIKNDGTGDNKIGNYNICIIDDDNDEEITIGRVENHDRNLSSLALVRKAIDVIIGGNEYAFQKMG